MEGLPRTGAVSKPMETSNHEKGGRGKNHKRMQKQQSLKKRDPVQTLCENKVKFLLCLTK
jgi:hypothetical protein